MCNFKNALRWGWRGFYIVVFFNITLSGILYYIGIDTPQPKVVIADIPVYYRVLISVLVGPVVEEIIFRGPLLVVLAWKSRPAWLLSSTLITTSVLFGAVHLGNYEMLTAGAYAAVLVPCVAGFVLGSVVIKSGSLFASIMAHSFNNTLVALIYL